jgi:hypothetical protein
MPNINSLNLSDEELPQFDIDSIPANFGARTNTPPPGIYRFKLPEHPAIENAFDVQESEDSQVLIAVFADEAMLTNITRSEPYRARISNRMREITTTDRETGEEKKVNISDFGMLLKALKAEPKRMSNKYLAAALVACAGHEFVAQHTLTARCNDSRPIYQNGAEVKGKFGCGKSYGTEAYKTARYERFAIPDDPNTGKPALRFACQCGAELRAWGQLQGFRSVS